MNFFEIFLLALALAVDAFIVSFSYGLIIKRRLLINSFKIAAAVGAGQFIMPIIGWYGTLPLNRYVEQFDHWLVFLVFGILGLNVIISALNESHEKLQKNLTLPVLFMIGTATSIDALAAGVSLYFAQTPVIPAAAVIGATSFGCSMIGFYIHRFMRKLPRKYMEISAGLVLILLGTKVLCEHIMQL